MGANQQAGMPAGSRAAAASRVSALARTRKQSRVELQEERAKSTSVAIISSLFLVVIAGALLIGGHIAIDPLLQSAIEAREARGLGEIVFTMPDGVYCRHVTFDNVTSQLTEHGIERCASDLGRHGPADSKFTWRAR